MNHNLARVYFFSAIILLAMLAFQTSWPVYTWQTEANRSQALQTRISVPAGYARVSLEPSSFGDWLRNIPMKPGRPDVLLYDGRKKPNQDAQYAVIDIDVSKKDLQQCADAVMRLRAEHLYSINHLANIHFNFTNGFWFGYMKWREGNRIKVAGNKVEWTYPASPGVDKSYAGFRSYLETVFTYSGTLSLSKEMKAVAVEDLQCGDVFIRGGSPGHAVVVMDVAVNAAGKKIFLLAQSYMPAQDMHILKNPNDLELSPWYTTDFGPRLVTPEWTFERKELRRF